MKIPDSRPMRSSWTPGRRRTDRQPTRAKFAALALAFLLGMLTRELVGCW